MNEPKNLAASIHQRLLNQAHETGRPFNELLQYYAIERFLYRLSKSAYRGDFVLKGALMLNVWGLEGSRSTRDIDLLGHTSNAVEQIVKSMREICLQMVEQDGLEFDPKNVQGARIKEDADYEGVRVTFTGALGKARVHMQIDIGFADVVNPAPVLTTYPSLLQMPAPRLRVYPMETVVSEKLQAMVALGEVNSRMKDFYDLWLLASNFEFDGYRLQKAVQKTFENRETAFPDGIPVALAPKFAKDKEASWQAFLKRSNLGKDAPSLVEAMDVIRSFLAPVLGACYAKKRWESVWSLKNKWK